MNLIDEKLKAIKAVVDSIGSNRLEMDVQRPSGCFDLGFLSSFTLCYKNITNIIARFGPKGPPSPHSVLINCHFDTLPDSPGATDDGVIAALIPISSIIFSIAQCSRFPALSCWRYSKFTRDRKSRSRMISSFCSTEVCNA